MTTSELQLKIWCRDFILYYQVSIKPTNHFPEYTNQEMNKLADLIIGHMSALPENGELILIPLKHETWAIAIDPAWPEMVYRADAIVVYPVVSLEDCCISQSCEVAA